MDFRNILLIVAFLLDFVLAIFVYFNNRKRELNIVYALMAVWAGLWSLGIAIFRASNNYFIQLFWNQEFIFTAALIASGFLHFSFIFSERDIKLKNWQRFLIYIPNVLILWAVITPGVMIQDIKIRSWGNESILGWAYIYYGIYFCIIWSWGAINLIKKLFRSAGIFRNQLKYILAGISISIFFGATFNLIFILFGNYQWIWLGPYASFIFLLTTTYAIVRYRLMDIRLVAKKSFIYFGVAGFSYAIFYLLIWLYDSFFGGVYTVNAYLAGVIIAPLFVLAFYAFNKLLVRVANKYFFVSLYSYQETINKLTRELNYLTDLNQIIDSIVNTIKQTMQLDRAGVLLVNQDKKPVHYEIAKVIGFNEKNGISLVEDNFLTRYLQKTQAPLVREELLLLGQNSNTKSDQANFNRLHGLMAHIEASLCLPLMSNNKLIGIIVLGSKISGDAYTKEDLELLGNFSFQAGIAIDNAKLYKEVDD
ncbi:MAG: GAF domain-containing protein, partial [Candidatus Buchananbacteria bacterium]|nr:GAF domain-containing protein [Candidatus Buchananbacteria bacterium]